MKTAENNGPEIRRMREKHVLIIEDNVYAMENVFKTIKNIPYVIVLKAQNSEQAYKFSIEYTIDLFIVDIILNSNELGDVSGIHFVERIRRIEKYYFTPIIFTTSMEDPQLYAFAQLHCYEYFEKPYDNIKFKKCVKEALKFETVEDELEFYSFKCDGIICPIKTDDIVFFENKITNLLIHCSNGDVLSAPYKSFKKLMLELSSNKFIKCNRNIIINKNFVKTIDPVNRYIAMTDGHGTFDIGQRMVKRVWKVLKINKNPL